MYQYLYYLVNQYLEALGVPSNSLDDLMQLTLNKKANKQTNKGITTNMHDSLYSGQRCVQGSLEMKRKASGTYCNKCKNNGIICNKRSTQDEIMDKQMKRFTDLRAWKSFNLPVFSFLFFSFSFF